MKNPEIVPDKISNPINRKAIAVILGIGFGIFIALNLVSEEDAGTLALIPSLVFSSAVAILSFVMAKQNENGILAKAYFFLGIAFTSYVTAEVLYYLFELILEIDSYPSIADVFFFTVYPGILIFLFLNMKYFHSGFTLFQKIWVPAIPIFALIVYVIMSISVPDAELNFDFYYGLIFVAAASITLSFTIIGALTFREGILGPIWFLLVMGLMINAAGDVWYYHLEIFGEYFDAHPVTVVWFVANMFMIYALYKHIKSV
jgi:hypothetical protein